jgi:nicotinamidase-related amidase
MNRSLEMNRRRLLKLAGAGGCGAAALLAGGALARRVMSRPTTGEIGELDTRFGLFDVDSRELNEAGDGLQFRARVQPLLHPLNRLYDLAERRNTPLVFTTCCSGRMLQPDSLPEILYVPMEPAERQWESRRRAHRQFYLAKNKEYDMFRHNGNAVRLVQALGVEEWVVFGNGFDMCIDRDVRALLAAGQKVCLLSNVYARSAPGYFVATPRGQFQTATPENEARVLAEFEQLGVRIATLEEFLTAAS